MTKPKYLNKKEKKFENIFFTFHIHNILQKINNLQSFY